MKIIQLRVIRLTFILLLFGFVHLSYAQQVSDFVPFGVSYEKIEDSPPVHYNMLILEPAHYSRAEIETMKKKTGARLIAYLSLGEVNTSRWYFKELRDRGFLGKNRNWNSYYINLEDTVSRDLFRDKIIPDIIEKGFDGFFLDTITSVAGYTQLSYLQPHMVSMIHYIRESFPNTIIIQNAGLFLLDRTHTTVNAVLMENVASDYSFQREDYYLKKTADYKDKVARLQVASDTYNLPFLIIDFSDTRSLTNRITARLDTLDFPYFIGPIELNSLSEGTSRGSIN